MFTSQNTKYQGIHSPQFQTSYRVNQSCSQDDYVSQFLAPLHEQEELELNEQKESNACQEKSESFEQESSFDSQSSFMSTASPKVKRSPLHNFQKHFVTTIRRNVNIRWEEYEGFHVSMAKQIWGVFKDSKKYTKQFVSLILGNGDSQPNEKLLKKYGLLPIYLKYDQAQFHRAQAFLKSRVVETFRSVPKEKIMYDRRIGKKEQFANYFFKVLSEIEEGVMNKRLPKKKRNSKKLHRRQN